MNCPSDLDLFSIRRYVSYGKGFAPSLFLRLTDEQAEKKERKRLEEERDREERERERREKKKKFRNQSGWRDIVGEE